MSNLTDNWFYPSAEGIWLCIRLNFDLKKMPILAKNIIFSDEAHLDFGGRLNNAGKWACDQLTEDADFGKKNHLFK